MTAYYRIPYRVPRRYRRRPGRSLTPGQLAGATAVAVVAAALVAGHHGHPTRTAPVPVTAGPWPAALLAAAGLPQTPCNLAAVGAWITAEGSNPAWNNRLDTTQREPGSWPVNSVGVQAYPDRATGLRATVTTLNNGYYGPILAALRSGDDAQAVADAVARSPWGTLPFGASC